MKWIKYNFTGCVNVSGESSQSSVKKWDKRNSECEIFSISILANEYIIQEGIQISGTLILQVTGFINN